MPMATEMPWPSEPVEVSTQGRSSTWGWPWKGLSSLRKRQRGLGVAEAVMRARGIQRRRGMALGEDKAVAGGIVDRMRARHSFPRHKGRRTGRRRTARRRDGRSRHERSTATECMRIKRAASASCAFQIGAGSAAHVAGTGFRNGMVMVVLRRLGQARARQRSA